jgi:eukaryotic-like serine/threonine-protein kinase
MATVWVARSMALDVDVALKLLHGWLTNTEAVERMAREAHAVARLGHPAIVRVIDYGVAGDTQPFIAMELLEGDELAFLLERRGKLPPTEAVSLLLPILDGLATAHQHGIVHRDIKPENIFIARDDLGRVQPKLVDFGIAKLESEGSSYSRITLAGALLGTPQYLSPEQAFGHEDVDFRTDIWSVGVVLYELVTGTPPFSGPNYNALIRIITQDAPLPAPVFGVADEQLWHVIERCLAKDPDDRWESAWALGEALSCWLVEHGVDVDASSRSLRDVWLDGGITDLRIVEGPSEPSPGSTPAVALVQRGRLVRGGRLRAPVMAALAVLGLVIFTLSAMQPKASALRPAPVVSMPAARSLPTQTAPAQAAPVQTAPVQTTPSSPAKDSSPKRSRVHRAAPIDPEFGF